MCVCHEEAFKPRNPPNQTSHEGVSKSGEDQCQQWENLSTVICKVKAKSFKII